MLSLIIRITSLSVCALCALVASFQIEMDEMTVPAGADQTVTLATGSATLTKPEMIAALNTVSDREDLTLEKIVVDPADYLHGRSLYRFGSAHPVSDATVRWYDPEMHGTRQSVTELGTASLDGSYAVTGPAAGVTALTDWAQSEGIVATVSSRGTGVQRLYSSVDLSGTGAALLAVTLLMIAALVTWHAVRARGRTLKMQAGVSSARLAGEDTLQLSRLFLVPAALVILVGAMIVGVRSGTDYVGPYLGGLLPIVTTVFFGTVLVSLIIGFLAEPTVAMIASRTPPISRFRAGSEATKVTILLASLVCIPLTLSSVLNSAMLTRDAENWVLLKDQLAINNFGALPGSEEEARTDRDFADVVEAADRRAELALSYSLPTLEDGTGVAVDPSGFQATVVVNPRFLQIMGTNLADLTRLSVRDLTPAHAAELGPNLELQVRGSAGWDGRSWAPLELYRLPPDTALTVVGYDDSPQLHSYSNPLIVLARSPGSQLSPDFLGAATSRSGVLFSNREHLVADLAAHGLADRATSIDRAADSGLLTLQISTRTMYFNIVAVVLLLGALAFGSWLAATSYVLAHARRLIPMRTGGLSWARIFRARAVSELVIAAVLTLAAAAIFALLDVPGVLWWSILVPVGYGALTITFHLSAGRRVFGQRLGRHY